MDIELIKDALIRFGPGCNEISHSTHLDLNQAFEDNIKKRVSEGVSEINAIFDYMDENFVSVKNQVDRMREKFSNLNQNLTQQCISYLKTICLSLNEAKQDKEKYELFCLYFQSKTFDQCESGSRSNLENLAREISGGFGNQVFKIIVEQMEILAQAFIQNHAIGRGRGYEIHDISSLVYYGCLKLRFPINQVFFAQDQYKYAIENIMINQDNALTLWHHIVEREVTPNFLFQRLMQETALKEQITSYQPVVRILENKDLPLEFIPGQEQLFIVLHESLETISLFYQEEEIQVEKHDIKLNKYKLNHYLIENYFNDPIVAFQISQILNDYYIYPGSKLTIVAQKNITSFYNFNEEDGDFLSYIVRSPLYGFNYDEKIQSLLLLKKLSDKGIIIIREEIKEKIETLEKFHHNPILNDEYRKIFYYFNFFDLYLMALTSSGTNLENEINYLEKNRIYEEIPGFYEKIKDHFKKYSIIQDLNNFLDHVINSSNSQNDLMFPKIEDDKYLVFTKIAFLSFLNTKKIELNFDDSDNPINIFLLNLTKKIYESEKLTEELFEIIENQKVDKKNKENLDFFCKVAIEYFYGEIFDYTQKVFSTQIPSSDPRIQFIEMMKHTLRSYGFLNDSLSTHSRFL